MMDRLRVDLPDGGAIPAELHRPEAGAPGVVLLLHEVFGVNRPMREVARWLTRLGHVVLLPDLYWRQAPGVALDPDAGMPAFERAMSLLRDFDEPRAMAEIAALIAFARGVRGANGRVATLGFCLGGRLAFRSALAGGADADIAYYPINIETLLGGAGAIRAPLMLHLARRDRFVPPAAQEAIRAALAGRAEVFTYDADHAFARPGSRSFDAAASAVAHARTAALLARVLTSPLVQKPSPPNGC